MTNCKCSMCGSVTHQTVACPKYQWKPSSIDIIQKIRDRVKALKGTGVIRDNHCEQCDALVSGYDAAIENVLLILSELEQR